MVQVVIVGNEPFLCIKTDQWLSRHECGPYNVPAKLLPAMKNMYEALKLEGMERPVTTAFNGGIMEMSTNPWTPCIADFKIFIKPLLLPILDFLKETESPFMVNIYSWFACMGGSISVPSAVGYPDEGSMAGDGNFTYYFNFDMQVDMQRVALCKNGYADLKVWIGETGWPSDNDPKATLENAYWYVENVIRRSKGLHLNNESKDNARWKGVPFSVFLFEAFDEEKKYEIEHGNRFENKFGLFLEDGTPKWKNKDGMLKFELEGQKSRVGVPPE